jgi:hypothetical protein
MSDYVSLVKLKQELGIVGSADDARLELLITDATSMINEYCGRSFALDTYVEKIKIYSQSGLLRLKNTPIQSITSITYKGVAVDASSYSIDSAETGSIAGGWYNTSLLSGGLGKIAIGSSQRSDYQVTYVGGYSVIPANIVRACIEIVRSFYKNTTNNFNIKSESIDGVYSVTYGDNSTSIMANLLNSYRDVSTII